MVQVEPTQQEIDNAITWIKTNLSTLVQKDYPNLDRKFNTIGTNIIAKECVMFKRISIVDTFGELIGHTMSNIETDAFAKQIWQIVKDDITYPTTIDKIDEMKKRGIISNAQL